MAKSDYKEDLDRIKVNFETTLGNFTAELFTLKNALKLYGTLLILLKADRKLKKKALIMTGSSFIE